MEYRRSRGVVILAISQITLGILPLVSYIFLHINYGFNEFIRVNSEPWPLWMILVTVLSSTLLLIFGIGILKLKNWARICSIVFVPLLLYGPIVEVIAFLTGFIETVISVEIDWGSDLRLLNLIFILYAVYLFFFTRPKVKAQFSSERDKVI